MNPIFIYQNEATLHENNKFSIIDCEIVNFITFSAKNQYYISRLDCNISKANKRKVTFMGTKALVDDLSAISRELLDKGADFKNDIAYVTSTLTDNYDLPEIAPQKYNIVLDPKVINDNCYKYQFYDNVDKRIKFAKIYSPFSHLKSGIIFKGDNIVKSNKVFFQLVQNYTKICCVFLQNADEKAKVTMQLYRDVNAKFVKEIQRNGTNRWWATSPSLTLLAQGYKNEDRRDFHVGNFMKEIYVRRRYRSWFNGKYKVIGNAAQRIFNGQTQPFIQYNNNIEIKINEPFFIAGAPEKRK